MASLFAHILDSGFSREQELALLDDEISTRLENLINSLLDKRDILKETIDPHRALLTPFRQLPKDMVQAIFIACLPTDNLADNAVMSAEMAPLLLCSIPVGMTFYEGAVQEMPARLFPALYTAVDTWLDRSGGCPLSLSVRSYPDHTAPVSAEFLEHLTRWYARWKSIGFTGNRSVRKFLAVPRSEGQFPMLEKLWISHSSEAPQDPPSWDLLRAPTLRDVWFKVKITEPLGLPLPWEQLTRLVLDCEIPWSWEGDNEAHGLTIESAIELLHRYSRLEKLLATRGPVNGHSVRIQNHSASELSVYVPPSAELRRHGTSGPPRDSESACLRASSTPWSHHRIHSLPTELSVKSLTDPPTGITNTSLLDTLARLSTITDLLFPDIDSILVAPPAGVVLDNDLLARLTPDSSGSNDYLCPRLEFVDVETMPGVLSDDALFNFIVRRATSAHPLKFVQADFLRRREWDIIPAFEPCFETGLQVDIHYSMPMGRLHWIAGS
ncbi:hypothetical protein B0H13DRAFT_2411023 [Mycena leptocephala]|nr:hypothetical protein B0H13DRAFT_2411023 [Mycena leptocephala]